MSGEPTNNISGFSDLEKMGKCCYLFYYYIIYSIILVDKDLQAAMEVEPKNLDLEEIGKQILEQPIEKQEIEAMEKVEILPMEEDFKREYPWLESLIGKPQF